MLPLAHLGIGSTLARPWRRRVPLGAVLLGTLLPDLVDKPLYYIPHWLTGKSGADLGLLSGTRSVAHSLLFFGLLLALTRAAEPGPRRRWWLGLTLGAATHLLLDNAPELFTTFSPYASRIALFFPAYGWRFPVAIHHSLAEHLASHLGVYDLTGEAIGLLLLWRLCRERRATAKRIAPA